MPQRKRRLWAAVFLPLLVWMLSGWSASGGWYCAGGARCQPSAALTCCCGHADPEDCCADSPGSVVASAHRCGCYFSAQSVDAQSGPERLHVSFPALPAPLAAAWVVTPPSAPRHLFAPEPLGPPGLTHSTRVTRGPPAA